MGSCGIAGNDPWALEQIYQLQIYKYLKFTFVFKLCKIEKNIMELEYKVTLRY